MTLDTRTQAGILAFRDGAPTEKEIRRLIAGSPEALHALIDARILALALALSAKSPGGEAPLPAGEDLLAYLTAPLSDVQRAEWEARLRGDPRAFAALLELRKMLQRNASVPPGPEDVPPPPARLVLEEIRWRVSGENLLFIGEGAVTQVPDTEAFVSLQSSLRQAERDAFEETQGYAAYMPEPDDTLDGLLSQLVELLGNLSRTVANVRETGQRPDAKTLFTLADRLRSISDEVASAAKHRPRPRLFALQDAVPRAIARRPADDTTATRDIPGIQVKLGFAGTGGPSPAVHISFQHQVEIPTAGIEVTFVISNKEFYFGNADPTGTWKFPLTPEPALLLVHGLTDRTVSIRITPAR